LLTQVSSKIRASAQGLFMMMTNGFGAIIGALGSGIIIDNFFVNDGTKDWAGIWLTFSIYALIVTVLFAIFFKHKHNPNELSEIKH
jgi:MFS family permease